MNGEELRELQAPFKARYREDPESAWIKLSAQGRLGEETLTCRIETGKALVEAGLHPSAGGTGQQACSGDMLLEALVACAGVTMNAVATSMGIALRGGTIKAEGAIDVRGTLGVNKEAPVGLQDIRLAFELDTDADAEQVESLIRLTERYCVIYQTLRQPPRIEVSHHIQDGGVG